jgi:protein-disulfide isomerase
MADSSTNKTTAWFVVGLIVLVTVVVIVAGAMSSGSNANSSTANANFVATTAAPITASDHVIGNPHAKVTLIEYGDFECPACGAYEPLVQQLINTMSSTVQFVFRNYPLTSIHPFAMVGAEAAEAAGMMGGPTQYWAMHNLLYAKQADWSTNGNLTPAQVTSQYFNGYAQSLGLNVATFDADMNSAQVTNKIQADIASGNAAQINHTPTFFVNLQQIPNPTSYAQFQTVLEQALASSSASSSNGTSSAPVPVSVTVVPGASSTITVTSTAK